MYSLISICDLSFWHILLSWLLPFLLGLIIGWFMWGIFKRKYKTTVNERDDLLNATEVMKKDLAKCRKELKINQEFTEDLKAQVRELESREIPENPDIKQFGFAASVAANKALQPDNLQIIEGIGPKMDQFLKSKGISNWKILASSKVDDLKHQLAEAGDKFRIIDPATWPQQAAMADNGEWQELIQLQRKISGSQVNTKKDTDSKLEKIMISLGLIKQWKKDDLKAIEGIGPKIEKLLHAAGIHTWLILSGTPVRKLSEILKKAGKSYQLADPATWPKQADLAAKGKWNELEVLQKNLKGGREVN